MNNNNNCYILISLIFINLLICVSCNDCWKVSTGIIGFIIIFKGFVYIFYYKPTQFIYPSQELTNVYDNNNNILSITIENTPAIKAFLNSNPSIKQNILITIS